MPTKLTDFACLRQTGKRAPRIDRRTLKLANYLSKKLPALPGSVDWISKVPVFPMYGNDTLGDCVEAAAAHCVNQWTFLAGGAEIGFNESDIVSFYSEAGGYIPGNPNTDNGTDMLTALNVWRNSGIGASDHKIAAYMSVDTKNVAQVKQAIALFGNLYLGVQLPISASPQTDFGCWSVPKTGLVDDGSPGSWDGHCIPVMAYTPTALRLVTWGRTLYMTYNFLKAYADEAYVILSYEWIASSGLSPSAFDLQALQDDLDEL